MNASSIVNVTYPPVSSRCPAISCAPTYIIRPPTTPSTMVDDSVIRLCAVSELITLSSSRFTPPANTFASLSSAW